MSFANQTAGDYSELLSATDSSSGTRVENKLSATVLPVMTFSNAITSNSLVWYSGGDGAWQDGVSVNNRLPLVAGRAATTRYRCCKPRSRRDLRPSLRMGVASGNSNRC